MTYNFTIFFGVGVSTCAAIISGCGVIHSSKITDTARSKCSMKYYQDGIWDYFNVHFLLFTFLYFFESEHLFYPVEAGGFFRPYIFSFHFGSRGLFHMGMVFLMVSIVLAQYNFFQIRRSIIIQKYYDLIFWTLLISFFSMLFLDVSSISHLTLLITPISFLIGLLVTRIKNPLILETLHLIFVFSALFLQLQNW